MSSTIDEILLLQASTTSQEFEWNGTPEEIDQWQSIISKYEGGEIISNTDVSMRFRLRLLDKLWLNVNYTVDNEKIQPNVILTGPSVDRQIWNKASDLLEHLLEEAKTEEIENTVFHIFTGLQSSLSSEEKAELVEKDDQNEEQQIIKQPERIEMSRVIFWSHHLKAPSKKRDMNKWCQELQTWGLVKSGYPGFLCFEGLRENVEEIVKRIKSLQWHAITVKTDIKYVFECPSSGAGTNDVYSLALRNCKLAKDHSSNNQTDKVRTSMDEVESGGILVQRLRSAGIPEDELMFALNLRD